MAQKSEVLRRARTLAEKILTMQDVSLPAFQAPSPAQTALLDLRKQAAELVYCLQRSDSSQEIREGVAKLEGAFRIAQLFNVISESELKSYENELGTVSKLIEDR